jgi:hypothetical protein
MYLALLGESSFFALLQRIDHELAKRARGHGCPWCGSALHQADYPRKPRGGPLWLEGEATETITEQDKEEGKLAYDVRFSFCCGSEGCRRRLTPPSVRFLGRRFYLGVVVVLAGALLNGATPWRIRRLQAHLPISRRTLARWRAWWLETYVRTPVWQAERARWMPPVVESELPASLLGRLPGEDAAARMTSCLRLLEPLTTRSCPALAVLGSLAW